ncbi:FGFR1 oncogene partner 2 homolog [Sycon ciliatum]|uniref:FGFR1 oncogene partner 2 homolog n=1 Tax=Sycon ciliatum TaxID=27933 RepID=UPI0020A9CE8A|eukprot:scpid85188/ scgid31904/ FGFR1 oncogene partner 2 homolog
MASSSLQKVLDDARWLLSKVQAQEAAAGGLEQCASELRAGLQHRTTEVTNGTQEAKIPENDSNGREALPRPGVGDYFTTEQSRLRQLRKENDDLRMALSEHQHVLEVIMVKYRQQISMLTEARRKEEPSSIENQTQQMHSICHLATQAVGMVSAMRKASNLEEDLSMNEQEAMSQLLYQHQSLHEMLETSRPFLSHKHLQTLIDQKVVDQTSTRDAVAST